MSTVIIQYNAGNTQSVQNALQRLGVEAVVTADPAAIRDAGKVIFPGVGAAGSAMEYLRAQQLDRLMLSLTQPVLGICLGLQLMCAHSEEEDTPCLGIFDVPVRKFPRGSQERPPKIPQMGWNNIYDLSSLLFRGIPENSFVYYVHSYYAVLSPEAVATTDYIIPYAAALHRDNFYGVQFHAEKSADTGSRILENFLKYT